MAIDPLSTKELAATCNSAIAVIEDLLSYSIDNETSENAIDVTTRLQAIVDTISTETSPCQSK